MGKAFASHVADLGSIFGITYGPLFLSAEPGTVPKHLSILECDPQTLSPEKKIKQKYKQNML